LAIATVTATLQQVLSDSLANAGVTGATASNLRPDDETHLPKPGVNIFLYQVTPNAAFRNADLPTRRADGTLVRRPQAALDLHSLLTFYGDDGTLEPQRLLGATILQLHSSPALTRQKIGEIQNSVSFPYLKPSNLADQVELVRVMPANLSLEEMNKLWMT